MSEEEIQAVRDLISCIKQKQENFQEVSEVISKLYSLFYLLKVWYTGKLTNLIESLIFFESYRKVEFVYGHAQCMFSMS